MIVCIDIISFRYKLQQLVNFDNNTDIAGTLITGGVYVSLRHYKAEQDVVLAQSVINGKNFFISPVKV